MEVLNLSHDGLLNALSGKGFTVKGKVKGWGTIRFIVRVVILGQERVTKGSSCRDAGTGFKTQHAAQ